MISQSQERTQDRYADEWVQLQTSLHTRTAITELRAAARSVEEAIAAAPHRGVDFGLALELVQDATALLSRIDAAVHSEHELRAG